MRSVDFVVDIKAGVTCFETALNLVKGKTLSTGYVYVKYIGSGEEANFRKYVPSEPDKLLRDHFVETIEPFN
jgi:hypothetical protein